jgi:hypothetical protein
MLTAPRAESSVVPSTRRRNRTKKVDDTDDDSTVAVPPTPRRRGRPRKNAPVDADPNDETYHPSSLDKVEEGDENAEEDVEAAAFAWGLITTMGLGAGSCGIYGAEVVAR